MRAVLVCIAHEPPLVLKGGTALRVAYGLDRPSEDLDFDSARKPGMLLGRIHAAAPPELPIERITVAKDTETVTRLASYIRPTRRRRPTARSSSLTASSQRPGDRAAHRRPTPRAKRRMAIATPVYAARRTQGRQRQSSSSNLSRGQQLKSATRQVSSYTTPRDTIELRLGLDSVDRRAHFLQGDLARHVTFKYLASCWARLQTFDTRSADGVVHRAPTSFRFGANYGHAHFAHHRSFDKHYVSPILASRYAGFVASVQGP
jgi:hypothetical protein